MIRQWMNVEHYRLHCIEEWPDSPHKEAVLAGIRSALESLESSSLAPLETPQCIVCASRKTEATVLMFPSRSQHSPAITRLAA